MQNEKTNSVFRLTREFDATQEEVFNAFSEAEALAAWWGPVETKNSLISLDFRPGGKFHYKMAHPDGDSYACIFYHTIDRPNLLEIVIAFTDENCNVIPAPFPITIPKEIFYRLEFSESNGKTTLQMTGKAINANAAEQDGFESINADMHRGFGLSYDELEKYLAK